MYGRIFKSLHILAYIDTDESYRRGIRGIRNLQEGRHALAGPRNCSRSDRSCMPSRRSRRADLITMAPATLMQAAQTA